MYEIRQYYAVDNNTHGYDYVGSAKTPEECWNIIYTRENNNLPSRIDGIVIGKEKSIYYIGTISKIKHIFINELENNVKDNFCARLFCKSTSNKHYKITERP